MQKRGYCESVLTDDQVREIRTLYAAGVKVDDLAKLYDRSYPSIYMVAKRRSYRHVPDDGIKLPDEYREIKLNDLWPALTQNMRMTLLQIMKGK